MKKVQCLNHAGKHSTKVLNNAYSKNTVKKIVGKNKIHHHSIFKRILTDSVTMKLTDYYKLALTQPENDTVEEMSLAVMQQNFTVDHQMKSLCTTFAQRISPHGVLTIVKLL